MKHNYDKRYTYCLPKNALPSDLVNFARDFDISKKLQKVKTNCLFIDGLCFLGSNLQ